GRGRDATGSHRDRRRGHAGVRGARIEDGPQGARRNVDRRIHAAARAVTAFPRVQSRPMLEGPRTDRAPRDPAFALTGANIVVGVGGGIAAYKAAELVRMLDKAGATVQVAM